MANKNGARGLDKMKQSQQDRTQNLRKWREQRLHEETLPSGLQVILRDVDLAGVMLEGSISNTLIDLISSEEFQSLSSEEAGKRVMGNDAQGFNVMLKKLIEAAFVEPVIGDVADDKHLLYSELSLDDKLFVFSFLNRDAAAVRSFRDE
jgi:hypothetical protein